jgi:hypothetical protein
LWNLLYQYDLSVDLRVQEWLMVSYWAKQVRCKSLAYAVLERTRNGFLFVYDGRSIHNGASGIQNSVPLLSDKYRSLLEFLVWGTGSSSAERNSVHSYQLYVDVLDINEAENALKVDPSSLHSGRFTTSNWAFEIPSLEISEAANLSNIPGVRKLGRDHEALEKSPYVEVLSKVAHEILEEWQKIRSKVDLSKKTAAMISCTQTSCAATKSQSNSRDVGETSRYGELKRKLPKEQRPTSRDDDDPPDDDDDRHKRRRQDAPSQSVNDEEQSILLLACPYMLGHSGLGIARGSRSFERGLGRFRRGGLGGRFRRFLASPWD